MTDDMIGVRALVAVRRARQARSRTWGAYVNKCGWSCALLKRHRVDALGRALARGLCLDGVDACGVLYGTLPMCLVL